MIQKDVDWKSFTLYRLVLLSEGIQMIAVIEATLWRTIVEMRFLG